MKHLFQGIAVSPGIGVGRVKIIDCSCPDFTDRAIEDTDRELGRFVRALKNYCNYTRDQIEFIKKTIGEPESRILNGHIEMTHDPYMQAALIAKVSGGMCAEKATCEICDEYIHRFLSADVEFVRQVATDVKDVKLSMLNRLTGHSPIAVECFGEDTIVVARELLPSVIARLDRAHTKAIITEVGSFNSHGAFLARAMKIPSITGVKGADKLFESGDYITVNADTCEVTTQ